LNEGGGSQDIRLWGESSTSNLRIATNNAERLRITTTGNTLIGTTTDTGHKLTVSGSGTSGSVNLDNTLYVSGSRVGIGTSTPTQTLDVVGIIKGTTSAVGNMLSLTGSNNTSLNVYNDSSGRAFIEANSNPSAISTAGAYFTANGYQEGWFNVVARQASTNNKIWRFGNLGANNYFAIQKLNDAGDSILSTALTVFSSTSNIGINTTTDAGFKLDVNGTFRVTDNNQLGWGNGNYFIANNATPSITLYLQSSVAATFTTSGICTIPTIRTSTGGISPTSDNSQDLGSQFGRFRHGWLGGQLKVGDATAVNASAKVQIDSTTQGFLPPRMTGAQAELISSPAEGLMVYATTGTGVTITSKGWWGYDGATWVKFN
jgi:hypothetical protein